MPLRIGNWQGQAGGGRPGAWGGRARRAEVPGKRRWPGPVVTTGFTAGCHGQLCWPAGDSDLPVTRPESVTRGGASGRKERDVSRSRYLPAARYNTTQPVRRGAAPAPRSAAALACPARVPMAGAPSEGACGPHNNDVARKHDQLPCRGPAEICPVASNPLFSLGERVIQARARPVKPRTVASPARSARLRC
jgi:hypothetical protein